MHSASSKEIVGLLIKKDVDASIRDEDWKTAFDIVNYRSGPRESIGTMLAKYAILEPLERHEESCKCNNTKELVDAISMKDFDLINTLLERRCVEPSLEVTMTSDGMVEYTTSPLGEALKIGDSSLFIRLLEYNRSFPQSTSVEKFLKYVSFFQLAAGEGKIDICEQLLLCDLPITPNTKNQDGLTILQVAVNQESIELCEALLKKSSECKEDIVSTLNGNNFLHFAVKQENMALCELILTYLPNLIDQKNQNGDTPLHCATKGGSTNIIKFLIRNGADKSILDISKNTACFYWDSVEAQQFLLAKKDDESLKKEASQQAEARVFNSRGKVLRILMPQAVEEDLLNVDELKESVCNHKKQIRQWKDGDRRLGEERQILLEDLAIVEEALRAQKESKVLPKGKGKAKKEESPKGQTPQSLAMKKKKITDAMSANERVARDNAEKYSEILSIQETYNDLMDKSALFLCLNLMFHGMMNSDDRNNTKASNIIRKTLEISFSSELGWSEAAEHVEFIFNLVVSGGYLASDEALSRRVDLCYDDFFTHLADILQNNRKQRPHAVIAEKIDYIFSKQCGNAELWKTMSDGIVSPKNSARVEKLLFQLSKQIQEKLSQKATPTSRWGTESTDQGYVEEELDNLPEQNQEQEQRVEVAAVHDDLPEQKQNQRVEVAAVHDGLPEPTVLPDFNQCTRLVVKSANYHSGGVQNKTPQENLEAGSEYTSGPVRGQPEQIIDMLLHMVYTEIPESVCKIFFESKYSTASEIGEVFSAYSCIVAAIIPLFTELFFGDKSDNEEHRVLIHKFELCLKHGGVYFKNANALEVLRTALLSGQEDKNIQITNGDLGQAVSKLLMLAKGVQNAAGKKQDEFESYQMFFSASLYILAKGYSDLFNAQKEAYMERDESMPGKMLCREMGGLVKDCNEHIGHHTQNKLGFLILGEGYNEFLYNLEICILALSRLGGINPELICPADLRSDLWDKCQSKRRGKTTGQEVLPGKSPGKLPGESPGKSPEALLGKSPGKLPGESTGAGKQPQPQPQEQEQAKYNAVEQAQVVLPVVSPVVLSVKLPEKVPEKVPGKVPQEQAKYNNGFNVFQGAASTCGRQEFGPCADIGERIIDELLLLKQQRGLDNLSLMPEILQEEYKAKIYTAVRGVFPMKVLGTISAFSLSLDRSGKNHIITQHKDGVTYQSQISSIPIEKIQSLFGAEDANSSVFISGIIIAVNETIITEHQLYLDVIGAIDVITARIASSVASENRL